jgi:hypothetical protein
LILTLVLSCGSLCSLDGFFSSSDLLGGWWWWFDKLHLLFVSLDFDSLNHKFSVIFKVKPEFNISDWFGGDKSELFLNIFDINSLLLGLSETKDEVVLVNDRFRVLLASKFEVVSPHDRVVVWIHELTALLNALHLLVINVE